ncbi:MAG TPA: TIGR00725 family protein [Solirubrobacteraceae bacterium]|nr:TIGR00725 family protein [Solirubrobacteraceae bacterium]
MPAPPYIAVVGASQPKGSQERVAEEVGRGLAAAGAVVITGGGSGVMAGASRGAQSAGGTTVGILPGLDRRAANPWVSLALPTGLGELRNGLIIRAADAVVAVGGGYGTLSEIALALRAGVAVVAVDSWPVEGAETVDSAGVAVARALELAGASRHP